MRRQCPQCGESKVNRIHRRTVLDYLWSLCFIYSYSCRACSQRFTTFWSSYYIFKRRKSNGSVWTPARRQDSRFEASFTVVFSWEGKKGEGIVTNLGLGGCRVITDVELLKDCCLKLKLQVPGCKPEIRVEDAVVRTIEKGSFGLSFSRVLGDERKRLCQYLVQQLKEKKRLNTDVATPRRLA